MRSDLQKVINHVKPIFAAFGSVQGISLSELAEQVRPVFRWALNEYSTNDDLLGVRHVHASSSVGLLPPVFYAADGGAYRVRFSMHS